MKYMVLRIQINQDILIEFCHKWRIRELSLFSSALREDFSPESDLDFLEGYGSFIGYVGSRPNDD